MKTPTKQLVWTSRDNRATKGTLEPLLIDGEQPTFMGTLVCLFHSKRNWWLNYGMNHNTGHFKSKKAAIAWWVDGGR